MAIGVFAFDVSSWCLHLWQVAVQSKAANTTAVATSLYRYLVLPSFVIARFVIWPALWYSAAFESAEWLTQLEQTLWPGSANTFRILFHVWMTMLLCFSVFYFRRLIVHQRVQMMRSRRGQLKEREA